MITESVLNEKYLLKCWIDEQITLENNRNREVMHLTANENVLSETARKAASSSLADRYHIGTSLDYDGTEIAHKSGLFYRGLPLQFQLEQMAHSILKNRLGGAISDTRPLSGMHAMISSIASLSNPGDVIFSLSPQGGGHFATGNLIKQLGRTSCFVPHDPTTLTVSLDALKELKSIHKPSVMFIDDSSPLYQQPFNDIKDIMGDETTLVYDASHTLGLIFGKMYQNPINSGFDVLQGNTHKTFPGPQKALIHYADNNLGEQMIEISGNSLVSSQHTHHSMALYITLLEMNLFSEVYATQMCHLAKVMAEEFASLDMRILHAGKSYTETNQLFLKVPENLTNHEVFVRLLASGISVNVRKVYDENIIRIGVQEIARRGMQSEEIREIARIITQVVKGIRNPEEVVGRIDEINSRFDTVKYSLDEVH